jgi:hypothetical protein
MCPAFYGRSPARGNSDRVALAIVFQPDFLLGRFAAVLHLNPIFSPAKTEGEDEARGSPSNAPHVH